MITARFSEIERYDINWDCEVVQMTATTNKGSYYSEIVLASSAQRREARETFKKRVVEAIQRGVDPCEIDLDPQDD